jgi:N-acetylmuramoyl-L-alanine amidase
MSVSALADRLGLKVARSATSHVMLRDSGNRVLIFADPDGRAYVNGKALSSRGGVRRIKGVMYVPRRFEASIRALLRTTGPEPMPEPPDYTPPTRFTVVIDPGHGGKDPGAVSCLGFHEKTVNLAVALELSRLLRLQGIKVKLTRDRDVFIPLNDRAAMADAFGADLFVSIHADSCGTPSVRGYTVYVSRSASVRSRSAARVIGQAMARSGLANKGIREGDFRVLVRTRCPALLVELGYLSNPLEAALLSREEFLAGLARILALGIRECFQGAAFTL